MSNTAQNEWLSLFTTDVQEIWFKNPVELRLIFTAHHILQKELKKFETEINDKMEGFKRQLKLAEMASNDDTSSSSEFVSTQKDHTANFTRSPKIQRARKRLHKNSTSPSLLTVKSLHQSPSYVKPFQENPSNFLTKTKTYEVIPQDLDDVVNSSIIISDSPTKKTKFVKRSDLLKKKKSNSLTLTQLYENMTSQSDKVNQAENVKQKDTESLLKRNLFKDYDTIAMPKSKSVEYPHKTEVVRKKVERMRLPGWSCAECKEYYSSFDLPPDKLKEKMDQCSKHRNKFEPLDDTPRGFWDVTMYSSQED
ncbi:hypothetical protein RI129_006703 [Pyrocoelia pectoralis]|uniref:DNA endonuclease activator Ctp1 C-terminal domain-containing protein n=1 Tax=Pyrocoelia pectoralis TaxID=417401 RepID=A0AAN7VEN5_9COLE